MGRFVILIKFLSDEIVEGDAWTTFMKFNEALQNKELFADQPRLYDHLPILWDIEPDADAALEKDLEAENLESGHQESAQQPAQIPKQLVKILDFAGIALRLLINLAVLGAVILILGKASSKFEKTMLCFLILICIGLARSGSTSLRNHTLLKGELWRLRNLLKKEAAEGRREIEAEDLHQDVRTMAVNFYTDTIFHCIIFVIVLWNFLFAADIERKLDDPSPVVSQTRGIIIGIVLSESGAEMHVIQAVLGHSSVATTEKYYAHFSPTCATR